MMSQSGSEPWKVPLISARGPSASGKLLLAQRFSPHEKIRQESNKIPFLNPFLSWRCLTGSPLHEQWQPSAAASSALAGWGTASYWDKSSPGGPLCSLLACHCAYLYLSFPTVIWAQGPLFSCCHSEILNSQRLLLFFLSLLLFFS